MDSEIDEQQIRESSRQCGKTIHRRCLRVAAEAATATPELQEALAELFGLLYMPDHDERIEIKQAMGSVALRPAENATPKPLHIPKSLHRQIIILAAKEGVSVGAYIASAIAGRVGLGKMKNEKSPDEPG